MVQKIELSAKAIRTFEEAIAYLELSFSKVEVQKFTDRIEEKISVLKFNPRLGRKFGKKPNVYKTVINKKIVLYYQYRPIKNEILLLAFWNTMQNPRRLKL